MTKSHLARLLLGMTIPLCVSLPATAQRCEQPIPDDCLRAAAHPLPGVRFAYGATDEGEAWVARFDGDRIESSWKTKIGGDGRQTVEAVALRSENKELLVAGGSTSPSLEGFSGESRGGRDGIVFRLDVETGALISGLFVGGEGDDLLTGVAEGANGDVLVAGHASERLDAVGEPPAQFTLVQPASSSPAAATHWVFLADVGPDAKSEIFRHGLGDLAVQNPRVWIDCYGNPMIGVTIEPLSINCNGSYPDLVYEQDQIGQNYALDTVWGGPYLGSPPGGFGYHAMRWKEYHANATSTPPYVLDWSLVPGSTTVPKAWDPTCPDAGTLNSLETQVFLKSGVATDPPGGWSCGNHANLGQLSLYTAYLHKRWGTPVYTHLGRWDDLNPSQVFRWYTDPVAIERTVFEPYCINPSAYTGQRLEDLCNLSVNSVNDLTCTTSTGIPGVVGTGFYLKLKNFQGAIWGIPLGWTYRLKFWNPDTSFFWQDWYESGVYLMDPPEGSEKEVEILEAASHQLSGLIAREGRVLLTRIEKGHEVCGDEMQAIVPASE